MLYSLSSRIIHMLFISTIRRRKKEKEKALARTANCELFLRHRYTSSYVSKILAMFFSLISLFFDDTLHLDTYTSVHVYRKIEKKFSLKVYTIPRGLMLISFEFRVLRCHPHSFRLSRILFLCFCFRSILHTHTHTKRRRETRREDIAYPYCTNIKGKLALFFILSPPKHWYKTLFPLFCYIHLLPSRRPPPRSFLSFPI